MRAPGTTSEPLRRFTPVEKLLLAIEISLAYVGVHVSLRRGEFSDTVAAARRRDHGRAPTTEPVAGALLLGMRLGTVVQQIFRFLPGDTRCLTRSLVLLRLLSHRQIDASLVIGVRTSPTFGAHAWVEHAGHPLLEPIEATGQRLVQL